MQYKLLNNRPMMDIQDTYTLRGICMLMIIVHHVIKLMPDCPMTIWRWGDLGTAVFFFISGWGLYCSMEKREKVDFGYLWQNLKKLLVPFFIVWAVIEIAYQIIHPEIGWSGFGKIWFIQVITGAYVVSILTFMAFKQRLLRLSLVALICSLYIYSVESTPSARLSVVLFNLFPVRHVAERV